MGKKIGILSIAIGVCLLASAAGLIVYNKWEDMHAETASMQILHNVQQHLSEKTEESVPDTSEGDSADHENQDAEVNSGDTDSAEIEPGYDVEIEPAAPSVPQMPTTNADGYECIGILSIPVLNLELPVLTDWNYSKLKVAPCVYYGSYYEKDFVIAGHNYRAHFKRFPELQSGDIILLTDVTGKVHYYEVVLLETLTDNATEQMITSGFDLTLYTCTPGGGTGKVTVRCKSIDG